MDATLIERNGVFHVVFRVNRKQYSASLKTRDESLAKVRVASIHDCLYKLERGLASIPHGVDVRLFVLSGGTLTAKTVPAIVPTLSTVGQMYLEGFQGEENSKATFSIYLRHFATHIGDPNIGEIALRHAQSYADARGKLGIAGQTVHAELVALRVLMKLAWKHGLIASLPTWQMADVRLPKRKARPPFRTYEEIQRTIDRGGLSRADERRLWDTLFLTSEDLLELLDYLERRTDLRSFVYPMACMVALTGCRRSEMLRSRIDDWDFTNNIVSIREKKKNKGVEYTYRHVDLHPRLRSAMLKFFEGITGQFTISDNGASVDNVVKGALKRALARHPKFRHIKGFHTFRHSVCSILASKGVDQRYIDKIVGHCTLAQTLRYQHLLPKGTTVAISQLL